MNSIKQLLLHTAAAIALSAAGIALAQIYGEGELSFERGDETHAQVRAETLEAHRLRLMPQRS
jgi:hypothetical protein